MDCSVLLTSRGRAANRPAWLCTGAGMSRVSMQGRGDQVRLSRQLELFQRSSQGFHCLPVGFGTDNGQCQTLMLG
eukprot:384049-Amphidinium_carterae.3